MNGYANGYNNGYWNGYWNGYYNHAYQNNYFNSYDNNSYYYGPRTTTSANSRAVAQPSMAQRYVSTIEKETQKPFEATHGRDNNPHMKPTTVNDYMSKPVRGDNNSKGKPVTPVNNNNSRPVYSDDKPVNKERPVNNNNQRPVYNNNEKPVVKPESKPAERPVYEQPKPQQRPAYEQKQKPAQQQKPSYEQSKPKESQIQMPAPAPRSNNSGGNRGGNIPSGPRKR
jgi:hypothetical protein